MPIKDFWRTLSQWLGLQENKRKVYVICSSATQEDQAWWAGFEEPCVVKQATATVLGVDFVQEKRGRLRQNKRKRWSKAETRPAKSVAGSFSHKLRRTFWATRVVPVVARGALCRLPVDTGLHKLKALRKKILKVAKMARPSYMLCWKATLKVCTSARATSPGPRCTACLAEGVHPLAGCVARGMVPCVASCGSWAGRKPAVLPGATMHSIRAWTWLCLPRAAFCSLGA